MHAASEAANDLVRRYQPLARAIAHRIHARLPKGVDVDDLVGAAMAGLVDAVARYDRHRSVPFHTYAKHRIHGAVMDALRADDVASRSLRTKIDGVARARRTLTDRLGRRPTHGEIAEHLGRPLSFVDQVAQAADERKLVSLDIPCDEDNPLPLVECVASATDTLADITRSDRDAAVRRALGTLPDRERTAVSLYYLQDLSLKEVGAVLGVSESRACQLCGQGLRRLRELLADVA